MKSLIFTLVISIATFVSAGNLGYVNSVQKVTGADGNAYIEVGHSSNEINVNVLYYAAANPVAWYSGPVYIPLGQDETTNALEYATMVKCLSDHDLQLELTGGVYSSSVFGGNNGVIVMNKYKLVKP